MGGCAAAARLTGVGVLALPPRSAAQGGRAKGRERMAACRGLVDSCLLLLCYCCCCCCCCCGGCGGCGRAFFCGECCCLAANAGRPWRTGCATAARPTAARPTAARPTGADVVGVRVDCSRMRKSEERGGAVVAAKTKAKAKAEAANEQACASAAAGGGRGATVGRAGSASAAQRTAIAPCRHVLIRGKEQRGCCRCCRSGSGSIPFWFWSATPVAKCASHLGCGRRP
jgi:hypothetical protein